ncbi:hypothetical protein GWD52_21170 [Enterobacteriaceae bacterium 4M9]|nr:hypothetical protein [Enterobacteriaceae bacterium 4M9]
MSATSEWVYTNVATIYPRQYDDWSNTWTTGAPYLIDCTWTATSETATDDSGKEFTTNTVFFTELKREGVVVMTPERDWYIATGDTLAQPDPLKAGAKVIRVVTEWDMSFFEEDPDYKILT